MLVYVLGGLLATSAFAQDRAQPHTHDATGQMDGPEAEAAQERVSPSEGRAPARDADSSLSLRSLRLQTGAIAGRVTEAATGNPLPGVNVVIEGTSQGAATDQNGRYRIEEVEAGTYTLRVSFVGYAEVTREGAQVQANQTTTVNFQMSEAAAGLDEVVVVGYGEQQRRDLSGSVSSVSVQELSDVATTSLDQGLQGQVAGMNVTRTSGQPGGGTSIRVRGGSSINAGNEPLYVVDGVPFFNTLGDDQTGVTEGPAVNPLSNINPNNITSIDVLKGPSATAIYGARGSNGVILIETKEGQAGATRVDYSTTLGVSEVRETKELLNAEEFARISNEAHRNSGEPPRFTEEEVSNLGEGTDWQEEIFENGFSQEHNLTVSGGNESTQYLVSGNFKQEEGIIIGSDFERGNMRTNIDTRFFDDFRVNTNITINRTTTDVIRSDGGRSGLLRNSMTMHPTLPVQNSEGEFTLQNPFGIVAGNPVAEGKLMTNQTQSTRVIGSVISEYDIIDDLTARVRFGVDIMNNDENFFAPSTILRGDAQNGVASIGATNRDTWTLDNTLNYDASIGSNSRLKATGGFSVEFNERFQRVTGASNFPTDKLSFKNLSAGSRISTPISSEEEWSLMSGIGRVNYIYDDRYILTFTSRVDGSSRFGEDNQFGFFPSGAAAWRISEEPFFDVGFVESLKIRLSMGVSGNQEIDNFQAISTMASTQTALNDEIAVAFFPERMSNPDLKWEKTNQTDIGIDASFFNGQVSMSADYYNKTTKDMLFNVPNPLSSGFASSLRNLGEMENEGFEGSVTVRDNVTEDFSWNASFNISTNKNTVIDLGERGTFFGDGQSGKLGNTFIVREGLPIGAFWGFKWDGVFADQSEVDNSAQPNADPGESKFVDINNNGKIGSEDRTVIGDANPDFNGGMNIGFEYKNFELSSNLIFVYGNDVFNATRIEGELPTGGLNNFEVVLNRWTPDNRQTNIPKASREREVRFSDRWIEDGSYLRVQNLTLGYNLPDDVLQLIGARNARVFFSGKNLFVFTDYSGLDPEFSSFGQNELAKGHDLGSFPQPRSFTGGFTIGF